MWIHPVQMCLWPKLIMVSRLHSKMPGLHFILLFTGGESSYFFDDNDVEHLFICIPSFEKCVFRYFAHFCLTWLVILFLCYKYSIFQIQVLCLTCVVKYVLSLYGLPFHFLNCVPLRSGLLNIGEVKFVGFLPVHGFCVLCKNLLPVSSYHIFLLYFL